MKDGRWDVVALCFPNQVRTAAGFIPSDDADAGLLHLRLFGLPVDCSAFSSIFLVYIFLNWYLLDFHQNCPWYRDQKRGD